MSSLHNFNPLPRKRENGVIQLHIDVAVISIHSLVRGRTDSGIDVEFKNWISIHSLVRGRTERRS